MEKLAEALERIAAKLGVTVQYLWPKVVLVEWVQSLIALLVSIAALAIGLGMFPRAIRNLVALIKTNPEDEDLALPIIKVIVFAIFLFAGVVSASGGWYLWISALISPEGTLVLRALGK